MATSPLRHRLPQSMKIVHEIMYKVEVLYVLCVLLMGRQRNQVRGWETKQTPHLVQGRALRCRHSCALACIWPPDPSSSGTQDVSRVPSDPRSQQLVWQANLEEVHLIQSCGAWPEWELWLQSGKQCTPLKLHYHCKFFGDSCSGFILPLQCYKH